METLTLGPLTVRRVVKAGAISENHGDNRGGGQPRPRTRESGKPPLVLVLAHGFGAPGDDLVGLADEIDVPPGTVMIFPEALLGLREVLGQPMFGDALHCARRSARSLRRGAGRPRRSTRGLQ